MRPNTSPEGISDYAARTIRHKARQLVGKAGFKKHDIKDLEQEMTLDLLSRLPKFDPDKAAQSTFVARVIERKISKLIRHRRQEMRDHRRETCSLNEVVENGDGETTERACTIDQDEADMHAGRRSRTREDEAHLRLDVSLVLSGLPEDLREVAEHLMSETVTEAAKSLGMPRTTLYGAIGRLRRIFEDAGLREYLL